MPTDEEHHAFGIETDDEGNVGIRLVSPIGLFLFGSLVIYGVALIAIFAGSIYVLVS